MAFVIDEKGNVIQVFGVKNGKDAPIFAYKGVVATVGDLPSGATAGDVYHVTADDKNYAYNGSTWDDLGTGKINGAVWGAITGTLSSQTDLNTALNGKASLSDDNTFTGMNEFDDSIMADSLTDSTGIATLTVADDGTRKIGSVLKGLKLATNSDIEVRNGSESNIGYVIDTLNVATKIATGYDATKTQILKNVQGTLTWVDE